MRLRIIIHSQYGIIYNTRLRPHTPQKMGKEKGVWIKRKKKRKRKTQSIQRCKGCHLRFTNRKHNILNIKLCMTHKLIQNSQYTRGLESESISQKNMHTHFKRDKGPHYPLTYSGINLECDKYSGLQDIVSKNGTHIGEQHQSICLLIN